MCVRNLTERPWDGNTSKVGDKPDVFAPVSIITSNSQGEPGCESGTSFAAPLVTAAVAIGYSEVRDLGYPLPNPYQARASVRDATVAISESETGKLNAVRLCTQLEERLKPQAEAE